MPLYRDEAIVLRTHRFGRGLHCAERIIALLPLGGC